MLCNLQRIRQAQVFGERKTMLVTVTDIYKTNVFTVSGCISTTLLRNFNCSCNLTITGQTFRTMNFQLPNPGLPAIQFSSFSTSWVRQSWYRWLTLPSSGVCTFITMAFPWFTRTCDASSFCGFHALKDLQKNLKICWIAILLQAFYFPLLMFQNHLMYS